MPFPQATTTFNLPALAQSLVFQGSRGAALAFVTTLLLCVLAGHAFHRWVGRPLLRTLHRPGSALPVAPAARSK